MGVLGSNHLLAAIPQQLLVPNNRFEKPLQRPRRDILILSYGFDILALHV